MLRRVGYVGDVALEKGGCPVGDELPASLIARHPAKDCNYAAFGVNDRDRDARRRNQRSARK